MEENAYQINGGIMINVDVNVKNVMHVKKDYVWNPDTCNCGNGKYLAIIMDDSAIICDEILDAGLETKLNDEPNLSDAKLSPKNKKNKF